MIGIAFLAAAQLAAASPIHVRQTGEGKDCWVLLHPLGMSGKFWDRRARLLADQYHVRIYAPDLPDHGGSALVPRFDYDISTDAVATALRRTCPRPQLVIGASSGGIVGMKLAARTGTKAVAIGVGWSFSEANVRDLERQARSSEAQDKYLDGYAEQGEPQVKALYRSFHDLAALGTAPLLKPREVRTLSGRLLVINGDKDAFFSADSAEQIFRQVRNSRLKFMPGADHLGPLGPSYAPMTWGLVDEFFRFDRKRRDAGRPRGG